MAKVEAERETAGQAQGLSGAPQIAPGGLVVGLPGLVDMGHLQAIASGWSDGEDGVVVVHPAPPEADAPVSATQMQLLGRDMPAAAQSALPWLGTPALYAALLGEAETLKARACAILNADMAALTPAALHALTSPVLAGDCDLAMPIYRVGRFDGLLNQAILAPVARALYGKRVQYPLAQDFAVSAEFLPALRQSLSAPQAAGGLLWPATEAIRRDRRVYQVYLPVHHTYTAGGLDLPALLQQVVGPLFADMEKYAATWQRIRGSQATVIEGIPNADSAAESAPHDSSPDPHPMVEAFQLAQRNLQEVWSLVLPPVTLLELKKLSRQPMESFRMADALWARVVYDFALAHRLRTLSRGHLLGALAPIYLGWVGSRVLELEGVASADARQEQLERAFEENKPYLVQRWRWPDRFNP